MSSVKDYKVEGEIQNEEDDKVPFKVLFEDVNMKEGDQEIPLAHHTGDEPSDEDVVAVVEEQINKEASVYDDGIYLEGKLVKAKVLKEKEIFDSEK